jgi:hypothetical protein
MALEQARSLADVSALRATEAEAHARAAEATSAKALDRASAAETLARAARANVFVQDADQLGPAEPQLVKGAQMPNTYPVGAPPGLRRRPAGAGLVSMRLTLTPTERAIICELAANEGISASIVIGKLAREEHRRRVLGPGEVPDAL